MDKEKFQEIYPHNLRLDCDIQKYSDEDGNLQFWNEEKRLFIPNEVAEQSTKSLVGTPILAPTPKIENITKFLEKRYTLLDCYFENDKLIYNFSTDGAVLKEYADSKASFVFLSIDMVKSTELSLKLSSELYSIVPNLFLNEIAIIIRMMGGNYVLII